MSAISGMARLANVFARSSSLAERLGFYPDAEIQKLSIGYNLWLHAASTGEVNAITPFCRAFRKARPSAKIILTTTSQSGKKIALEKGVADSVFLAPLDSGGPLKRAFSFLRPIMVLAAETEIWPNWLLRTGSNGIPLLLINGRVSDRSFPKYKRFGALFRAPLNCFNLCLVQTREDQERLQELGVGEKRIQVVGQMKYDLQTPDPARVEKFRNEINVGKGDILFTLGSLRGGEDDLLLPLVPEILGYSPDVKVLVAPRHLKNIPVYRQKLDHSGVSSVLRSEMGKGAGSERVIVLDTLGELSLAYALSRAAFVGGTLVPVGGHNLMEPALSSVPVCFGTYTQNVREAAKALIQSGGGIQLKEAGELAQAFKKFLDLETAKDSGRKAYGSVIAMRGATQKMLDQVLEKWPLQFS